MFIVVENEQQLLASEISKQFLSVITTRIQLNV